jgi:excinuclease ABC subunit B
MYADKISDAMNVAIRETARRRKTQETYNIEHNITPTTIIKEVRDLIGNKQEEIIPVKEKYSKKEKEDIIRRLEKEMMEAAKNLDFEKATELRDIMFELKLEYK